MDHLDGFDEISPATARPAPARAPGDMTPASSEPRPCGSTTSGPSVFVLGDLVGIADNRLVVQRHVVLLASAVGAGLGSPLRR
jgi:hypothetical protein